VKYCEDQVTRKDNGNECGGELGYRYLPGRALRCVVGVRSAKAKTVVRILDCATNKSKWSKSSDRCATARRKTTARPCLAVVCAWKDLKSSVDDKSGTVISIVCFVLCSHCSIDKSITKTHTRQLDQNGRA
jgi:hypothetical protein